LKYSTINEQFYGTAEGRKILNSRYWPDKLKDYRMLENKYLLENMKEGKTLLDVGCGNGVHLILLQSRMKRLIGIDCSENIVNEAERLTKNFSNTLVFRQNIKTITLEEKFDYIICMFNTFGNIDGGSQVAFIKKITELIKPDGRIFLSVYSEKAKNTQIEFYKNIGLTVADFDDNFVYTDKFISERFTKEKIVEIVGMNKGLKIQNIIKLNDISRIVNIRRKSAL